MVLPYFFQYMLHTIINWRFCYQILTAVLKRDSYHMSSGCSLKDTLPQAAWTFIG